MSNTIQFTKSELKEALTSVLHTLIKEENSLTNDCMFLDNVPEFPHTDRAFVVGDILYVKGREKREKDGGGTMSASTVLSGKILSIENGQLVVDKFKRPIDVKNSQILTTDTWLKFYESYINAINDNTLSYSAFEFDYENIDGELYVVAKIGKTGNAFKKAVKYTDLKNGNIKFINIKVENEQSKSIFRCPTDSVVPFKAKADQPNTVPVNSEWVRTINNGAKFGGWVFPKAKEIVRAMPWLFDNEALWFDPKSNKSKRLVLRDFINSRSQQ